MLMLTSRKTNAQIACFRKENKLVQILRKEKGEREEKECTN